MTPEQTALRERPDEMIKRWEADCAEGLRVVGEVWKSETANTIGTLCYRLLAALAELKASKLCECPLMKKDGRLCEG